MLEDLFHHYVAHRAELHDLTHKHGHKEGWRRALCDYVSGMTDRYAMAMHRRLFGERGT
jgi:dGTPase